MGEGNMERLILQIIEEIARSHIGFDPDLSIFEILIAGQWGCATPK